MDKVTVQKIIGMKKSGEKIAALTCYHSAVAGLIGEAGIDIALVGDSLNMVLLGCEDTLSATLDLMLVFTKAVKRAGGRPLIVGDMPFLTYGVSIEESIKNAGRFLSEGGAEAVKVEGGERIAPTVEALVRNNIPVMGHLGLTPQSVHQLGGYKVQGKTPDAAKKIKEEALMLEEAGAFAVVLECVPQQLGKEITESLAVPTIGIGAGRYCNGQVLVIDDLLGVNREKKLKFAKKYLNLGDLMVSSVKQYVEEVKTAKFPDDTHSY